jgi:hypothetical protein
VFLGLFRSPKYEVFGFMDYLRQCSCFFLSQGYNRRFLRVFHIEKTNKNPTVLKFLKNKEEK